MAISYIICNLNNCQNNIPKGVKLFTTIHTIVKHIDSTNVFYETYDPTARTNSTCDIMILLLLNRNGVDVLNKI